MDLEEWKLSWVVCHRATRSVSRSVVRCPLRGRVDGATCLACRFLTTSSVERQVGPWCEAWPTPARERPAVTTRVPIPVVAPPKPRPADWPLRLPVVVTGPAVRPPVAVPSGHGIGT